MTSSYDKPLFSITNLGAGPGIAGASNGADTIAVGGLNLSNGAGGAFGLGSNQTGTGAGMGAYAAGSDVAVTGVHEDAIHHTYDNYGNLGTSQYGVEGVAAKAGSSGVHGVQGPGNYAGLFDGDVQVNGNLAKSGGSFLIDHPLDPANKTLSHSFVESPDMKNVYDGVAVLGEDGEAVVELPEWFEALNRDFRYQLTCIGGYAPVYIADEIADNRFRIAGGSSGLKVSWQVTGIRQDAWANAHRIPVEEMKSSTERGRYLHPELFGAPPEASIFPPPGRR